MRFANSVLALLLTILATPTFGEPILDQASPAPTFGASWAGGLGCPCGEPGDYYDLAQTFTFGVDGQLVGADVYINSVPEPWFADLQFDVRLAPNGIPAWQNTSALVSLLISGTVIPRLDTAFFQIDLSAADLEFTAGRQLAFVLRSTGNYGWAGQPVDPYAGGGLFGRFSRSSSAWSPVGHGAMAFRTYVEPVPESASLVLLVSGLAGLIAATHRRRT